MEWKCFHDRYCSWDKAVPWIIVNGVHGDGLLHQLFHSLGFYTMNMIVLFVTTFRICIFSFPVSDHYLKWVLYLTKWIFELRQKKLPVVIVYFIVEKIKAQRDFIIWPSLWVNKCMSWGADTISSKPESDTQKEELPGVVLSWLPFPEKSDFR